MMQVFAVFLVVATICIFAVGKWSESQIKEKNDRLFGRWNEVFLNVDEEDVEYFRQHAFVDDYSVQNIQEKIYLEGDDRIIIGTCDDNFFELGNLEMVDGRMPVNEGEVAIEEEYLEVLGVEKVGDIISEGVNIDSLKGYKVCGIVKDYSSRWKMVNWDVKYINCFISDAKANEIQIYASLSLAVQQDIETNMLEYRENIEMNDDNRIADNLLVLWIGVISFSVTIYFNIVYKLKHNVRKVLDRSNQINLNVGNKLHFRQVLLKIVKIMFIVYLCYLTLALVNKIIIHENYDFFDNIQYIVGNKFSSSYVQMSENLQLYMKNPGLFKVEVLQIVPNIFIESVVETVNLMIWILLIHYAISVIPDSDVDDLKKQNIYIQLIDYYYGNKEKWHRKMVLCCFLKNLIIYDFLCAVILFINSSENSYQIVFSNFVLFTIINAIILYLRILFKYLSLMYRDRDNNDGLLATEWE